MENKKEQMKYLVDSLGFYYSEADKITDLENAPEIMNYIIKAYGKGKKDGQPKYNYSGGH